MVVQCVKKRSDVGLIGAGVEVDDQRLAEAGVGAVDGADGCPVGAIRCVLNVVAAALDRARAAGHAENIAADIGIGEGHADAATAKISASGEEIGVGDAADREQGDSTGSGADPRLFDGCWIARCASDDRCVIDGGDVECAGVGTALFAN